MADISVEIAAFKNAVYGEDVRDAMVSLANKLNNEWIAYKNAIDEIAENVQDDLNEYKKNIEFYDHRFTTLEENSNLIYDIYHLSLRNIEAAITRCELVDGTYYYTHDGSGNSWSNFVIPEDKITLSNTNLRLLLNIKTLVGTCRLYLIYTATDGSTVYYTTNEYYISSAGLYDFSISPTILAKHNLSNKPYNGKDINVIVANVSSYMELAIDLYSVYYDTYVYDTTKLNRQYFKELFYKFNNLSANEVLVNDLLVLDGLLVNTAITDREYIDNGKYVIDRTDKSGNNWIAIHVTPDMYSSGSVLKFKFNINNISDGSLRAYYIFAKNNGDRSFVELEFITEEGFYSYTVDPNYLAVYKDWNGEYIDFLVTNSANTTHAVIDHYAVYENTSQWPNIPKSLNSVLNDIRTELDDLESGHTVDESELIDPDGNAYIVQAGSNGNIILIPKIPKNILYLGNSLLLGFGNHGMASTTIEDDYYYKINSYLQSLGGATNTSRIAAYGFESCVSDEEVNAWISNTLSTHMNSNWDMVIIQLSDNVNTNEKNEEFVKSCGTLTSYIRKNCPNARVVWLSGWYYTSAKQTIIKNACKKYGAIHVDITDLVTNDNRSYIGAEYIDENGDTQTITNSGVASHPGDAGFTAIANRVIEMLFA